MKLFLSYAWRVVSNALQLLVVLYVFSRLNVRFEIIVISVLGLIYVSIRSIGYLLLRVLRNIALASAKEFAFLHKWAGEDVSWRELEVAESEAGLTHITTKEGIDGVTLFCISLVCLYNLFVVL